jgi:hypothetical protein
MTRAALLVLVVAVAILAWRDRQRERQLVRMSADVTALRDELARQPIAKPITSATLGELVSHPLGRQLGHDAREVRRK